MNKSIFDSMQDTISEAVDFYKEQKIILDLWTNDNADIKNDTVNNLLIKKFYVSCPDNINLLSSDDDLKNKLSLIKNESIALQDNFGSILDGNEARLSKEIVDALDIILGQVERFCTTYKIKADRAMVKINDDDLSFSQKREIVLEILGKCFSDFINETISAIYRGLKITGNDIYDLVLNEFNSFFKNIGLYTINIEIGSKIDLDICMYSEDESPKSTDKIENDDCVYEIKQLPYALMDGVCIVPGRVSTWRFEK